MIPLTSLRAPPLIGCVRKQILSNGRCIYGFLTSSGLTMRKNFFGKQATPPNLVRPIDKDQTCKQFTTIGKIFSAVTTNKSFGGDNKVSVIGLDDIGIATIFALLTKGISSNVCMIDMNEEILQGEHMDIQSSALFLNNPKITSSKDPASTRDSKVCVVTTGTYKARDEQEHEYVARNAGIVRAIVPPLAKYSPDTIFIVASDPVDILSYVTWKLSGAPKHRIIGLGTMLDTARFRYLLSDKFGVSPEACHAHIIGEHGEKNSVPVWSSASVGGVRLRDVNPQIGSDKDPEMWNDLFKDAVKNDDLIRQLKGTVSWSVALAVTEICRAIFTNSSIVTPVSTYVRGEHSIRDEIFLSLPCVIGKAGVTDIIREPLSDVEASLLRRGAENVAQLRESVNKILV